MFKSRQLQIASKSQHQNDFSGFDIFCQQSRDLDGKHFMPEVRMCLSLSVLSYSHVWIREKETFHSS